MEQIERTLTNVTAAIPHSQT